MRADAAREDKRRGSQTWAPAAGATLLAAELVNRAPLRGTTPWVTPSSETPAVRLAGKQHISLPANAFSQRFCVPAEAIDELGHVGNLEWVRWVTRAASAHSAAVGLDLQAYQGRGVVWVVRRHEVDYLAEALEGEELLAHTWIADARGATSRRATVFTRAAQPAQALVSATTTWALIDIARRRPVRIPADLLTRYGLTGGGAETATSLASSGK